MAAVASLTYSWVKEATMNVKELTRRWWQHFMASELDRAAELMADDVAFRAPGASFHGRDAVKPFLAAYAAAFPDLQQREVSWVVQGDHGICELTITGTHTGTLQTPNGPLPATGKKVVWNACDLIKAANGKIVSWTAYWDRVAFATQLGLAPGGK